MYEDNSLKSGAKVVKKNDMRKRARHFFEFYGGIIILFLPY